MRNARFAGWMIVFGVVAFGAAALRPSLLSTSAAAPLAESAGAKPAVHPTTAAAALAALQVSPAPGGGLIVFDASTGDVMRVLINGGGSGNGNGATLGGGDKPGVVETLGTLRKTDAGKWEFASPTAAPAATTTAASPAAAPPPTPAPELARITAARADVLVLMTALKTFRNDIGHFPSTEEGLQSLVVQPGSGDNWKGPYIKGELPKDPWGNPYVYRNPGKHNPAGVDVLSFGPDTRDGGDDDIYAP